MRLTCMVRMMSTMMIVVLMMSRRIVSYYDDSDIGEEDATVSFDI